MPSHISSVVKSKRPFLHRTSKLMPEMCVTKIMTRRDPQKKQHLDDDEKKRKRFFASSSSLCFGSKKYKIFRNRGVTVLDSTRQVYNLGNGGVPVHRDPVHGIGANHEK